ncbi:MAG: GAF domain-containing protein [Deltaproteobacteria bacterium]|nr:GAF domain-containing protein [Deltaproteobacteria bacterium]
MHSENVRFKTLSPGCSVDVQAMSAEHAVDRIILRGRRRARPSAGLIVESEYAFQIGALVLLDLKFPGQVYTYRSRGMVSWVVRGDAARHPHKMGVLIFGMDKLDEHGISVSLAAPPPVPREETVSEPPESLRSEDERSVIPETPPDVSPVEAEKPVSESANTIESPEADEGEMAAVINAFSETARVEIGSGSDETSVAIKVKEIKVDLPRKPDSDLPTAAKQSRSSIPSTIHTFAPDDTEIDVEVGYDHRFDIEGKMIEAFERMHEMYSERDHDGAASFAISLARDLITCETGSCLLISPRKYELYVAASHTDDPSRRALATRPATDGASGVAIRSGAAVRISDPGNDPRFQSELDGCKELPTDNLLVVPIQWNGHAMGTIELRNSPRKNGFVEGEAQLLAYIAQALAEYLHTSLPTRGVRSK